MKRFLVVLLLLCSAVAAQSVLRGTVSWDEWLNRAAKADVIYLGERHDSKLDHQFQLDTIRGLRERGLKPVIVAEMFQLLSREVLDEYVAGRLSDEQLKLLSQWDRRWRHDWAAYLPLWQEAREHKLALLPLRNSSETGKHLGKLGVEAFSPEEREGLTPGPYEFGPGSETLRKAFEAHPSPPSDDAFTRFLNVQTLWEEFMAAQVRKALALPGRKGPVVVLVGKGHLLHGHGLPWRVAAGKPLRQVTSAVDPEVDETARLDVVWRSL
jgi:uncharacterized iron-regulated protein